MKRMRLIIAGGRDFFQPEHTFLMRETLDKLLANVNNSDIEIVSGKANGADRLGEEYANFKGIQLKQFPAEWDRFGKSAGYKRNVQMAEYANHCVVFWDGSSKGSKHMIDIAERLGVFTKVINYTKR